MPELIKKPISVSRKMFEATLTLLNVRKPREKKPDASLESDLDYVMNKNRELYERLS